jgi:hypothetical protein
MITGLTRLEEMMNCGYYFDTFPWDRPALDPEMAAGDFLDAL